MTDPPPEQRKRIYQAQFRVSGSQARKFSAAISALLALLILAPIALLAFKMREGQAKGLFAVLVFMLIVVAGVGSVLLGVRRLLKNLAASAFQKSAGGNSFSFKWTVGPVVTKSQVIHNLNELPPELAHNPEVQKFLHRPEVQRLLQTQPSFSEAESQAAIDVGETPAETAPLEGSATPTLSRAEVQVITSPSDLPLEIADRQEQQAFMGRQFHLQHQKPKSQPEQRPDVLKWLAIVLGFLVLALGLLLLTLYFRTLRH